MVNISKIDIARVKLQQQNPFFSYLVKTTPLIKCDNIPTLATDGERIFYNNSFLNSLDTDTSVFALCHEIWHIISEHVQSREWRDPELWQYVVDVSTNNALFNCQFKIWEQAILNHDYNGWSVYKIYEDLEKQQKENKRVGKKDGFGNDLVPTAQGTKFKELSKKIKEQIAVAATIAKMAGQLPIGLEQFIDDVLVPKVNWKDLLYKYLLETTKSRQTWNIPNRRYSDVILPSVQNKDVGELVIIGDTSGSMIQALNECGSLIKDVARQLKPKRIRVIWADNTDCAGEQVFEIGQAIEFKPVGGGGTDMRKPLKYIEKYKPLACVLFTDCSTPWPDNTPYPLIVCSTTNQVAPIGKTVHAKI